MSKADECRQHAEEAMRCAAQSKNATERDALIELVRTWIQAAANERTLTANDTPSERRGA
jgi:hypothetical protein